MVESSAARWSRNEESMGRLRGDSSGSAGRGRWPYAEVAVGKVEIAVPVPARDVVLAGAQVISDRLADRRVGRRLAFDTEPLEPEQAVHRLGGLRSQELAERVRPAVLGRARDVERPGRDQREQQVLVH